LHASFAASHINAFKEPTSSRGNLGLLGFVHQIVIIFVDEENEGVPVKERADRAVRKFIEESTVSEVMKVLVDLI
jgi:hypothetical protein